ncbi:hypothetical protein [Streptomyces sp. NPDC002187]|uniref:hypothetical protein n=1 Tax=Streptomyces sp. NPDC002187 TaxID=3364637 RepID=UPI0036AF68B5
MTGHLFPTEAATASAADLRRRMRDYVRGLLAPVGRENGRLPAEFAGHRTPDGLQRLLNGATWTPTTCATCSHTSPSASTTAAAECSSQPR